MRNELLWAIMLLCNFICIMVIYYRFGKIGLFAWVPVATILANIQVVMLVRLFGMEVTLGNILYAGGYLVTDLLAENYGKEDAKKAVYLGFFSMIAMTIIMQVAIHFTPSSAGIELFDGVKGVFALMPRLAIASLLAYLISQQHDIWAYEFWRYRFQDRKYIWIRNNASTMVSQLLDSFIFTVVAFYGVFPLPVLWEVFIGTYLIKFLVAICDTPFIYLGEYLKRMGKIQE
ncbi:queuosine precursor transporter [Fusobacterium gonidiaformans]|uniref:queuosine precursor transporter n=1 Tax=Fusobacterium gonidiaformans TaxID=849 RepID=UPI00307E0393